ncbi:hypothetical protein HHK36_021722 [Tetracentron sinense]|uniref:Neprosin PEP catalytic domain-containing protein n=1 Tax=Tetracentron sinense TaxID=13715 RepID=A0A835D7M3_TETSI|nr:hypothetical protein HHK36_021722 [Tetracentron sinense]
MGDHRLFVLSAGFLGCQAIFFFDEYFCGRAVKDSELVRHKAAVKTIESEGDVIDCVDIYKQPAFDHPLLKNHKIQYATVGVTKNQYYGAEANINVWNPKLGDDSEMSVSQIWVSAGTLGTLNTAEAGMTVNPTLYGDDQTRFFVYWTSDNYVSKGCYNLNCPGFVQTNGNVAMGAIMTPVSDYGAKQVDVNFFIFKDKNNGNWWVKMQGTLLGYWPSSIFTTMADSASAVNWGGEIFNSNPQGHHTATQMGSGHFPSEGNGKASYFSNLGVVDSSNTLIIPTNLSPFTTKPTCYDLQIGGGHSTNYEIHFYYGGPGYSKECP